MTIPFVGREAELADIGRLLRRARLVTLTGAGGVGKTSLVRRAVELAEPEFPGGVWPVDLATLPDLDAERLARAVADAVGLGDPSPLPTVEALAAALADRRALLVLDTCDHLVEEAAELATVLLRAAPRLCVAATSRQPFGVPGEHVYPVPPLRPDDAVELLRTCLGPDRDLPREELAGLCARLDGLPLAIELAAVRLRTGTVAELLRDLDARYDLAGGGTGAGRHVTLRTAIGWSHEACTPQERLLWARLSVFPGDFDLRAAEYVGAGGPLAPGEVLYALAGLVDKSVVLRVKHAGRARYRLLASIREFGADWLAMLGEEAAVRERYRDYLRGAAGSS